MEKEHLAYMIIKLLADDQNAIPYRPPIARVYREHGFRSPINTTILLQQAVYWWAKEWKGHRSFMPFYKFNLPNTHKAYRPGQSWVEELGMTEWGFKTARKKVGLKKRQGAPLVQALSLAAHSSSGKLPKPIVYWSNAAHLTYYTICIPALLHILTLAYPQKDIDLLKMQPDITQTAELTVSKRRNSPLANGGTHRLLTAEPTVRRSETTTEITQRSQQQQQSVAEVADLLSNFGIIEPALSNSTILNTHPNDVRAWIMYCTMRCEVLTNPGGFLISKLKNGQNPPLKFRLLADLPQETLTWLVEHEHLRGRLDDNIDLPSGLDIELANLWFRIHNKEDE